MEKRYLLNNNVLRIKCLYISFYKNLPKIFLFSRVNEEQSDASKVSVSLEDECLGDFLYASEPPEDSIQLSSVARSRTIGTDTAADVIAAGREVLNSRNYRQSSSLRVWLTDLAMETENECGSTLQSKNLPRSRMAFSGGIHARDLKMLSSAATAATSKLLVTAERFEQHYRSIVE